MLAQHASWKVTVRHLIFFLIIFGKDSFAHIAEQTNLYAAQNPPSAHYSWADTTTEEIMLYSLK
jgi:hypothetical protein